MWLSLQPVTSPGLQDPAGSPESLADVRPDCLDLASFRGSFMQSFRGASPFRFPIGSMTPNQKKFDRMGPFIPSRQPE